MEVSKCQLITTIKHKKYAYIFRKHPIPLLIK